MAAKPGRNDPCWCGSGTKYKKCHLDADETAARARTRELADARRDVGRAEAAPPGVSVRAAPPPPAPQEEADARFNEALTGADLDARVALVLDHLEGPEAISDDLLFDQVLGLASELRAQQRSRDLDTILEAIATHRPELDDFDQSSFAELAIENALFRGEDVSPVFRRDVAKLLRVPSGLGVIELLAFHGYATLLTEVLPGALPPPADDDGSADNAGAEEAFGAASRRMLDDVAYLCADLLIAEAVARDPAVVSHPEALLSAVAAITPVEPDWFDRVLRRHAAIDPAPLSEHDFTHLESARADDATILATHDFARWLRARTTWPLARNVLARMCLADVLMHHLHNLRRPSRRGLLLPAATLLRYVGEAAHPASGVALLLAGAWWTQWLGEQGWVDPAEAARELRVLRRDWPTQLGEVGTAGGDPHLGEALANFWQGFSTAAPAEPVAPASAR